MTSLLDEFNIIQNPAIGAAIIWQAMLGYAEVSEEAPSILVCFLILPIIMHPYSFDIVQSTQERTGLVSISNKLAHAPANKRKQKIGNIDLERGAENLFSLNVRAGQYRTLTLQALTIAEDLNLISISEESAVIFPKKINVPLSGSAKTDKMLKTSFKFGRMCGEVSLSKLSKLLQVSF